MTDLESPQRPRLTPMLRRDVASSFVDNLFEWGEQPTDADVERAVRAYIGYHTRNQHVNNPSDDDPEWWAVEAFMRADERDEATLAWRLIVKTCELATPERDE